MRLSEPASRTHGARARDRRLRPKYPQGMPLADKRILVSGYNVLTARSMLSDMRFHLRIVGTTPSGQSAVLTANFYPQARDLLGFRPESASKR